MAEGLKTSARHPIGLVTRDGRGMVLERRVRASPLRWESTRVQGS